LKLTVTQTRGGQVESEHPVCAVRISADGRVIDRIGEPMVTTWRSAAKPFQLEVSLGLLPAGEIAALSARQLAVGASSHNGEPGHLIEVAGILTRFHREIRHLYCGPHWPGTEEAHHALVRQGLPCTAIHNNCSGKHAFMAAASSAKGWPEDYRSPDHPLQQRIRANVDARTGGGCSGVVIDGCGVPCFVVTLDGMALAWAALAADMGNESLLGRIGRAMVAESWYANGTGTLDGAVIRGASAPTVAKVGAQGLFCLSFPETGEGAAIKVVSGSDAARGMAVAAVLERWFPGRVPADVFAPWREVHNWVGTRTGEQVARWEV
jgi:L-asparaginase II